jgi:hypothetical protein
MRRAVAAMLIAWAGSARAEVRVGLVPELRLGGGYDDNLFLDADPARTVPSNLRADGIFDVAPRLVARLAAARHALVLSADYLERITLSNGDLRDAGLRLDWASAPVGPLRFLVSGVYEHYEADRFPDNTFDLGGGEAGLRLTVGDVRLQARYRAVGRSYSDPARAGQLDFEQHALGAFDVRLGSILTLGLGYGYLHLDSSNPSARLERHRGELLLSLRPVWWLLVGGGYSVGGQHLPHGALLSGVTAPRDEFLQTATATVVARPIGWLELFARYDWLEATSDTPLGNYHRNQVLAGLAVFTSLERGWQRRLPAAPEVREHWVNFRYRGRARSVSVVGDWNGWDPSAAPLGASGDGFAGRYALPPGRHEYAFAVDGTIVAPPDAPRYVDDGFGGRNGVIEVP